MNNEIVVQDGAGNVVNSPAAGDIIASGGTMQQVKTQFTTAVAVQRPRATLQEIVRRVEEEAMISGEEFYYSWAMKGGGKVEGPSIKMTNALARLYGNCVLMPQPIQEMKDAWIFTTAFIDLETGYTRMRSFRQSKKWQVFGKFDDERKDDIRFQIGQSKADRNAVTNSIPPILIKKAMDAAKLGVRKKIEQFISKNGIQRAIEYILAEFKKEGATKEMIEKKMYKKAEKFDVDDLVLLKGDLSALQDGVESLATMFVTETEGQNDKPADEIGVTLKKTRKKKIDKPDEPAPVELTFEEIRKQIVNHISIAWEDQTAEVVEDRLTELTDAVCGRTVEELTQDFLSKAELLKLQKVLLERYPIQEELLDK